MLLLWSGKDPGMSSLQIALEPLVGSGLWGLLTMAPDQPITFGDLSERHILSLI